MKVTILLIVVAMFFVSCGKSRDEQYSYNFKVNNCATAAKSFSSLSDMCVALADDSFNNNCAGDARCDKFQNDCLGLNLNVTCESFGRDKNGRFGFNPFGDNHRRSRKNPWKDDHRGQGQSGSQDDKGWSHGSGNHGNNKSWNPSHN